ncbi:MAG TPA: site-2 protease family protein [Candidatus Angelobacter sp.]|nr:site-2 protease family protein [Candidatus Angelobacter sp.]
MAASSYQEKATLARRAVRYKRTRTTGRQLQFSGVGAKQKYCYCTSSEPGLRGELPAKGAERVLKNAGQPKRFGAQRQKSMRNWSIFTARFGGREIRIHLTFIVLLLFLLLVEVNRNGPRVITRVVIITGLILLSALLHEFGHVWVSARQGFPIKGFVLLPIGGLTMGDPSIQEESARNLRKEISIALAGPLVNAVLAGITAAALFAMGLAHTIRLTSLVLTPANLVTSFFWINACLFVVNLLPAFPLDGGRILRAVLARGMDFRLATRRAVTLGQVFAGIFMLAGAALNIQGLMLIGFFIFVAAQMEERTVMFQTVVEAVQMEDIMLTEFSVLSPADTLEDALNKAVHCLQDDFPVVSGGDLVGVITRQTIVDRLRAEGNGYVQAAMSRAFEIASRTESLGSAFRKLTSRGLSLIPVVDQERLVGIVTLQHLMHSMGLLNESRRLRRQMEEQS